ncbi:hypothetical protein Tco_0943226, partial [Tanacetum coccineum]
DKEEEREEEEKWPTFVCDVDDPKNYGISMKMRNIKDVSLLLEESSVYLDALVVDNMILEFGKHGDQLKFGNATKLGYGEQYTQLLDLQRIKHVGNGHACELFCAGLDV